MPWTARDASKHKKGLTPHQARVWARVANSALKRCKASGGSDCDARAIRQANAVAGRTHMEDEKTEEFRLRLRDIKSLQTEENDSGLLIKGVPVFRAGTHRGIKYSIKQHLSILPFTFL